MASSNTVHSNAFGFMSFLNNSVDPRTGQYVLSINLPTLNANALRGPSQPLQLAFSPLNTQDAGFGKGWSLNLSQYTPSSKMVALSTGESFKVTGSGENAAIREHKLDSFHFSFLNNNKYRIVHKSGLVEELKNYGSGDNLVALPHTIYAASGHAIYLDYDPSEFGRRLKSIRDEQGLLLEIDYASINQIDINIAPEAGGSGIPKARYQLKLVNRELTEIVLPSDDKASWRLKYTSFGDFLCVNRVLTPTGGRETIHYDDEGHAYPDNAGRKDNLPRVTRHMTYPGSASDPGTLQVNYVYTGTENQIGHNFLGAGADVSWEPDGVDNLYKAPSSYTYSSTSQLMVAPNKIGRSVKRIYNRFHLLIEEETTQNNCVQKVTTTYHNTNESFDYQPPQFQAPKQVVTRWSLRDNATQFREETVTTSFDEYGNPLQEIKSSGVTVDYCYYPADYVGDDCPPDPHCFVRNLRSQTVTPSGDMLPGAQILQTFYSYQALPALNGSEQPAFLVIAKERLVEIRSGQKIELQLTSRDWFDQPDDALIHGQAKSQCTVINNLQTESLFDYSPVTFAVKQEQSHTHVTVSPLDIRTLKGLRADQFALQIKETLVGFDDTSKQPIRKTSTRQYSPVSGQLLMAPDLHGTPVLYLYDSMDRVVKEIVAPGQEEDETSISYTYTLSQAAGQYASQIHRDAKGVETHIQCDGLNRVLSEARLIPSDTVPTPQPRQTYAATWDAWGNLSEETSIDWLNEQNMNLRTSYTYDDWGQLEFKIDSSGLKSVQQTTPTNNTGPIQTSWFESNSTPILISDLSVTHFNALNKPTLVKRLDTQAFNSRMQTMTPPPTEAEVRTALKMAMLLNELPAQGSVEYSYDGLGNCLLQTEKFTGQQRLTRYEYDSWGRQISSVLPDGSRVHRVFAEHSELELVSQLQVFPANTSVPATIVGRQHYDGLLRLTEVSTGPLSHPRTQKYRYKEGQALVSECLTPEGNTIKYSYNTLLTELPTQIDILSKTTALIDSTTYTYDPKTADITGMSKSGGQRTYLYDSNNHLRKESFFDNSPIPHEVVYNNSLQGRNIWRSDGAVETKSEYDKYGRLFSISQNNVSATFSYNAFGLLHSTVTTANPDNQQNKSTLTTTLDYDTMNREIKRTFELDQQPLYTVSQTWFEDDQLQSRTLEHQGNILLKETYLYDPRGRLQEHVCEGEMAYLPKDQFGNAIERQIFIFDELDNIKRCISKFLTAEGKKDDIAFFSYDEDDRFKLIKVTHTYTDGGYPASQTFEYDANGNMLNDELGQRLKYDNQGRLTEVKSAVDDTVSSQYRYDGHNHLVGVIHEQENECLRFYQGTQLSHTLQDKKYTHFLLSGGVALSQQLDDHNQTLLLLTDASPSVIGESLNGQIHLVSYSAYGEQDKTARLQTLLAFNSEVCEPLSGWYLLGRGYRAYNPGLMRFHSPDSLSPFGAGGVNPYVYCLGNPIRFRDPTGHYIGDRGNLPQYYEPLPEPEGPSFLEKWLYVGLAALGVIASIIFLPISAPMIAGAVMQIVGLGLQIAGTASENGELTAAGVALGAIGGMISFMGAGKAAAMQLATKASAVAKPGATAVQSTQTSMGFLPRARLISNLGGASKASKASTSGAILKPARVVRKPPTASSSPAPSIRSSSSNTSAAPRSSSPAMETAAPLENLSKVPVAPPAPAPQPTALQISNAGYQSTGRSGDAISRLFASHGIGPSSYKVPKVIRQLYV